MRIISTDSAVWVRWTTPTPLVLTVDARGALLTWGAWSGVVLVGYA